MLKILGGHLKGMKLKVASVVTRPTSVMLRRRFFDQYIDWPQIQFIDLCAGTGAMALEAASRGCFKVIAYEKNKEAFYQLKAHLEQGSQRLQKESISIECKKTDYRREIKKILSLGQNLEKTYMYFDPPYEMKGLYKELGEMIAKNLSVAEEVTWWIESDIKKGYTPDELRELILLKEIKFFKQGTKFILGFKGSRGQK